MLCQFIQVHKSLHQLTHNTYDDRLFIELQVHYMKISNSEHEENMLFTKNVFDKFCTQLVLQKEELLTMIYLYQNEW